MVSYASITNIIIFIVLFGFLENKVSCKHNLKEHKNWHLINPKDCGLASADRIIGGIKASLGQFPWIVRIGMKIEGYPKIYFKCGGVILNQQYVLTAAHCLIKLLDSMEYKFRLGEFDATTDIDCENGVCAEKFQDFDAEKVILHKNYDSSKYKYDIALIRLNGRVKYNDFVSTICLPYGDMLTRNYLGNTAEVAGWGIQNTTTEDTSNVLLYTSVPVVKLDLCKDAFSTYAKVGKGQLCAGAPGTDSCGGDSGGPLMKVEDIDGSPRYYALGVVSFGSSHCGSDIPGVYTDVRHYMDWILDNIEP